MPISFDPPVFDSQLWVTPLRFHQNLLLKKTESFCHHAALRDNRLSRFNTTSACDGQTDRQTDRRTKVLFQYHAQHSWLPGRPQNTSTLSPAAMSHGKIATSTNREVTPNKMTDCQRNRSPSFIGCPYYQ